MATRTISNTGGNYNATGTWVEAVVPTSADDVVSTATSGQLTVNVAAAARSIDLTTYTNTVTINAAWNISGSIVTNTFGSGMSFAGTVGITFTNPSTILQNTTSRIPNLTLTTGTKTLSTNMYCVNFINSTGIINGNNIYISGNLGTPGASIAAGASGTTKYILDGSGSITFATSGNAVEMNTTGTYSTYGQGLCMVSQVGTIPSFILTAGNIVTFNIILGKQTTSADNYLLDLSKKITGVYYVSQAVGSGAQSNMNITLSKPLITDVFAPYIVERPYTTDNTETIVNILGNGLSASTFYSFPAFRTTSSAVTTPPTYLFKSATIKLNSDFTHNIGSFQLIGGGYPSNPIISSITASSPASINLISKTASQIINYDFTDINATGQQVVAINGTLTRTTNVTNVYPTGGGGGVAGGSFTFVN